MGYIKTILVADRDFGYTLNYNASSFSHDHFVIEITSAGLLDKVEFTADEKTGELIFKIMEFGKAIQESTFTPFAILEDDDDVEVVYDGFIQPFDSDKRKIITDRINALAVGGPRFSFEFDDDSAVGSLTAMGLDGANELVQDIVDSKEKTLLLLTMRLMSL
jgi:hypothetical protein